MFTSAHAEQAQSIALSTAAATAAIVSAATTQDFVTATFGVSLSVIAAAFAGSLVALAHSGTIEGTSRLAKISKLFSSVFCASFIGIYAAPIAADMPWLPSLVKAPQSAAFFASIASQAILVLLLRTIPAFINKKLGVDKE